MTNLLIRKSARPYVTIEKEVGETPLVALERARALYRIPSETPLAYAGRLDPMASGKLLILVGNECKVQEKYHAFDKEYRVEILLGAASDSGDVLGLITQGTEKNTSVAAAREVLAHLVGGIKLPYPHFSSKPVQGKPLHTWALENRLGEIQVPVKESTIHKITFIGLTTVPKNDILKTVRAKIETIPPVTDARKALGADFRRDAVRATWDTFEKNLPENYQILAFTCVASSGTYMRSLGEKIAQELGTVGLAYSIHRTKIGKYLPITSRFGFWVKQF